MDILQVENLSFTYPTEQRKTLDSLSFSVKSGDFVVVCGETGCGKTTLLRLLKRELSPAGEKSGSVLYKGTPIEELDDQTAACEIGFVMQKPENQIVTDKVWHELAFGLENMGLPTSVIRRRVSEMSSYFGIGDWFDKDTQALSGGQKQLLNLAAVMVMQPKVLILDEPTSQLDPIAAADFIATLQKLNRELGLTIVLVEHRLEEIFSVADKVLVLEQGKILSYDTPQTVGEVLRNHEHMLPAMPCAVRIYSAFELAVPCPLTVKDGRRFIEKHFENTVTTLESPERQAENKVVLELKNVWFRYEKEQPDVLKGTTFQVFENEIVCILGGNASGKTTALSVAAGLLKPYAGHVKVFGEKIQKYQNGSLYRDCLALLPQDAQTVFLKNTVKEDLEEIEGYENIDKLPFDLSSYMEKHPYDLSGGEQQLCALAKTLLQNPKILLLDEPTKGIDAYAKNHIIDILRELKNRGMTMMIVTHDVEFAALCADRCALFFNGEITSTDSPEAFFSENNFYTTAANRMTRYWYDGIVTAQDAIAICKRNGLKRLS